MITIFVIFLVYIIFLLVNSISWWNKQVLAAETFASKPGNEAYNSNPIVCVFQKKLKYVTLILCCRFDLQET